MIMKKNIPVFLISLLFMLSDASLRGRCKTSGQDGTGESPRTSAFIRCCSAAGQAFSGRTADLILFNGKVVTVDSVFSVVQAVAVCGEWIADVGTDRDILMWAGPRTRKIDLQGKTVLPGLIDAHLHPMSAAESEIFEKIPDVHSIAALLEWIKDQARIKAQGEWIVHPKLFFTRLKELRQPTLKELDQAAPDHPVFLNGTYGGMINSLAMQKAGIGKETKHPGIIRDPETGEPLGIIRASAFGLLKGIPRHDLAHDQKLDALADMLERYNRAGITSITDGAQDPSAVKIYLDLLNQKRLTVRVFMNIMVPPHQSREDLIRTLEQWGMYTGFGDHRIRIGALKIILDGGILTGTAYMREPWGLKAREIYGIGDPEYRGILNFTETQVNDIVSAANICGWKMTAHCTGRGAVDLLLDAYEKTHSENPIDERRFSIIHGNFFTAETITRCSQLGVIADCQPAWFYKDAEAMKTILGSERIKHFLPLKSMIENGMMLNGGSDHMIQFDPDMSTNPYNPFLGMWATVTRRTEQGTVIEPSQAVSRQEALKMYTLNNAFGTFEEGIKGSIEPGKLADMIVISEDYLTCPEKNIRFIQSELTVMGGEIVFSKDRTTLP